MHRILVIEDEIKLLHSLQRGLTQEDYSVAVAASGEEAITWRPHNRSMRWCLI